MEFPMMKCGHIAMALLHPHKGKKLDPPIPACVICDCYEPDNAPPNLTERRARCDYYGRATRKSECPTCGRVCHCEEPSSLDLAFFAYLGPGSNHYRVSGKNGTGPQEYDAFYCGCHSWN